MGKTAAVGGTCVVMARTSTKGQKDAFTIKAQITKCRELVAEYGVTPLPYRPAGGPVEMGKGVPVPEGWLIDDGRTGRLLGGRVFETFINDVRAGVVRPDYLVVADSDRTFRADTYSEDPALREQSAIDEAKVNSVLSSHRVKVIDKDGVHEDLRQKSVQNASELAKIRTRTMGGKAEHFAEGKRATGGRAPYGYRLVQVDPDYRKSGWRMEPHPEHAKSLHRLIDWFLASGKDAEGKPVGGYTYAAKKATEEKILTPMYRTTDRKGPKKKMAADWTPTRWTGVTVRNIMRNARVYYLGEQTLTFADRQHTLRFTPLIDEKTYEAIRLAQQELTVHERAVLLSTGFVDCAGPHTSLPKPPPKREGAKPRQRAETPVHVHASNSHGKHHVACTRGCGRMPEVPFNAALWEMVKYRLLEIAEHGSSTNGNGKDALTAQLKVAKDELRDVQSQLDQLAEWGLRKTFDAETIENKSAPLREAKAAAKAKVDRATGDLEEYAQKKTKIQTVEQRVGARLDEFERSGEPRLEGKRAQLAELLTGGRVTVTWPKRKGDSVTITLPPHGNLPAFTLRVDQVPTMHGGTVEGGEVMVMVKAPAKDYGDGRTFAAFSMLPLRSVRAGTTEGARIGWPHPTDPTRVRVGVLRGPGVRPQPPVEKTAAASWARERIKGTPKQRVP